MRKATVAMLALLTLTACGGAADDRGPSPSPSPSMVERTSEPTAAATTTAASSAAPGDRIYCSRHEIVAHATDAFQGERVDAYELYGILGEWMDDLEKDGDFIADESLSTYAVDLEGALLALRVVVLKDDTDISERVLGVHTASARVAQRCTLLTGEVHRGFWAKS